MFVCSRMIKRTPKLKLAVEALMASVKPMGNIVLICGVFFFFFGILGVQVRSAHRFFLPSGLLGIDSVTANRL